MGGILYRRSLLGAFAMVAGSFGCNSAPEEAASVAAISLTAGPDAAVDSSPDAGIVEAGEAGSRQADPELSAAAEQEWQGFLDPARARGISVSVCPADPFVAATARGAPWLLARVTAQTDARFTTRFDRTGGFAGGGRNLTEGRVDLRVTATVVGETRVSLAAVVIANWISEAEELDPTGHTIGVHRHGFDGSGSARANLAQGDDYIAVLFPAPGTTEWQIASLHRLNTGILVNPGLGLPAGTSADAIFSVAGGGR